MLIFRRPVIVRFVIDGDDNQLNVATTEIPASADGLGLIQLFSRYGLNFPVYDDFTGFCLVFLDIEFFPVIDLPLLLEFELSSVSKLERAYASGPVTDDHGHYEKTGTGRINLGLVTPTFMYSEVCKPWELTVRCTMT